MKKAERELRRILVSELGVDIRMFSPSLSLSVIRGVPTWIFSPSEIEGFGGYAPTYSRGRAQWGRIQDGVALFHVAVLDAAYSVVIGIRSDGTHEMPNEKTATAAEFNEAVVWLVVDR